MQEMQEIWVQSLSQEDPPGGENDNPLQYSFMDRGAWQAAVHGFAESDANEQKVDLSPNYYCSRVNFIYTAKGKNHGNSKIFSDLQVLGGRER